MDFNGFFMATFDYWRIVMIALHQAENFGYFIFAKKYPMIPIQFPSSDSRCQVIGHDSAIKIRIGPLNPRKMVVKSPVFRWKTYNVGPPSYKLVYKPQ